MVPPNSSRNANPNQSVFSRIKQKLTKIRKWLLEPKVWRYVCFASSTVALICYALSSFSTCLFGKWRWWKILIYSAVSSLICLSILFAKLPQRLTNPWLKANLAFLVFMITNVYSFFTDKKIGKQKPDTYSLISNAAFALMSLSWSRQTYWGIEVDVLVQFCGTLILQLMRRNAWLTIVGVCYSGCLFNLRSYLDPQSQSQQESEQFELRGIHLISASPQGNGTSTGLGTAQIQRSQQPNNRFDNGLCKVQFLDYIKELERNKQTLITLVSNHVAEHLSANRAPDVRLVIDTLPKGLIKDLNKVVMLWVEPGAESEEDCWNVYSIWRRQFLEECLLRRGWQEINSENWINVCTIAVRILFPNERKLSDRVFQGLSSTADISFTEICKDLTMRLLNFVVTFASTPGHHVGNVLDCIEASNNLFLDLRSLFSYSYGESLVNEVRTAGKRLRDAIRGILMNLERLISRDMENEAVPIDGGIHRITRLVMNHLCSFNRELLSRVLDSTIQLLESKLEAKSEHYTDHALRYIFLINNLRYIGHMAERPEIQGILGNDWVQKHLAKIEYNYQLYRRGSWDKPDHLFLEFGQMD